MKPLTRAESEVMNRLWDQSGQGVTINQLVELYAEQQPARTTVATLLKILEAKGYVEHRRVDGTGRTFVFSPLLTRERYVTCVLRLYLPLMERQGLRDGDHRYEQCDD